MRPLDSISQKKIDGKFIMAPGIFDDWRVFVSEIELYVTGQSSFEYAFVLEEILNETEPVW